MIQRCFGMAILLLLFSNGYSQSNWELKKDKDGIQIYTAKITNSNIRSVKVVSTVKAYLSEFVAFIMDIEKQKDWSASTKETHILKHIGKNEIFYRSEISIPWPISNRDIVVDLKVSQQPLTKIISIECIAIPDSFPEQKNIVRIKHSYSFWVITPQPNGMINLEYTISLDPGGSIPNWLFNIFSTQAPYDSFKKMREKINDHVYLNNTIDFIKN